MHAARHGLSPYTPITLRALRAERPGLFHPNQDWFDGESFMDAPSSDTPLMTPTSVRTYGAAPRAIYLALCYVADPLRHIWRAHYLWTSDIDRHGQRIYVGDNGQGLEIHRHIHLTARFGVPSWD